SATGGKRCVGTGRGAGKGKVKGKGKGKGKVKSTCPVGFTTECKSGDVSGPPTIEVVGSTEEGKNRAGPEEPSSSSGEVEEGGRGTVSGRRGVPNPRPNPNPSWEGPGGESWSGDAGLDPDPDPTP
ncbi:unnamed protein product, partial [Discosporangium mesarthrocarpum]